MTGTGRRSLAGLSIVLLGVLTVVTGLCCHSTGQEKREVVLYCSVDQTFAKPIIARFEKETGIRVKAGYDPEATKTVGLVQRLRAQRNNPEADVFWSGEVFYTVQLAKEGVLDELPKVPDGWPAKFVGPDRRWAGLGLRARVICYNTDRVKPDEAPKRLEDLLDPKWKGRIVMATPTFGTTGGDVASWFVHYGPDRAKEILQGLKANQLRLVPGNSTSVQKVATGQADIGLTDTDDVYAGQREGWPVALNFLDQGGDGVLTIPNTVARVKGGPNADAAAVLIDWILTGPVEKLLAESDSHNTPVKPAVAAQFPKYALPKPLAIDYQKVAEQLPEAIRTAVEILD